MKFSVTQAHIDTGVREDPLSCAVALCLKEQLPPDCGLDLDAVKTDRVRFSDADGHDYEWFMPPEVERWIVKFDDGKEVQPFEFELELPCPSEVEVEQ